MSFIINFPLFFLFMIEMVKKCGLLGKKKIIDEIILDRKININNNDYDLIDENQNLIELNKKNKDEINEENIIEYNIIEEKNNIGENKDSEYDIENNINNQIDNTSVKIPRDDFPLIDSRSSEVK